MRRFVLVLAAVLLASTSILVLPAPPANAITFSVRPAVWRDGVWFLRDSMTSGAADISFHFGNPTGDFPMMCDWDGNGTSTPGVFRDGVWFITNTIPPSTVTSFGYGNPNDFPLCGDWDGNGSETPGVVRGSGAGQWFFSDTLGGPSTHVVAYGDSTQDFPIAGDWDGNGSSSQGVARGDGNWFLKNTIASGFADVSLNYGDPSTDFPIVGDWDNNGSDTVGVFRETTGQWLLRNSNDSGVSDVGFTYGDPLDFPLVWTG